MALSVLIVDDSDIIRAMIGRTLDLAGLPIETAHHASNGREALRVMEDNWVDLVLADINMPVMNGASMLLEMRSRPETIDVPVVVVSTEGASGRMEELMRLGVCAWIRKPFTPEQIRDAVEGVLRRTEERAAYRDRLDRTISLVLEQFTFSFAEPADHDLPDPGDDIVMARTTFSGAACGTLAIAAPVALCAEFADNALGEQGDSPAELRGGDTLGEVLNMTCGHLATSFNAEAPTDVAPPVVTRLSRGEWDRMAISSDTRCYIVEDQPVLAVLTVRGPAAPPESH